MKRDIFWNFPQSKDLAGFFHLQMLAKIYM